MNRITFGIISGLIFGFVDILLMIPLSFSDKTAAMLGAFVNRFAIGFLIPITKLPFVPWLNGALIVFLIKPPRRYHYEGLCADSGDRDNRRSHDWTSRRKS